MCEVLVVLLNYSLYTELSVDKIVLFKITLINPTGVA